MFESTQIADCIRSCLKCSIQGEEALSEYLLNTPGNLVNADYIKVLTDCTQLTAVAADFMSRESNLPIICSACADICDQSADVCRQIGSDDIKKYSEVFSRSAKCCRELSHMAAAA